MRARGPTSPVSDVYILGWTEGMITEAILEQAAANGDMTRAGIVAAANEVDRRLQRPRPDPDVGRRAQRLRRARVLHVRRRRSTQFNPIPLGEGGGSPAGTCSRARSSARPPPTTLTTARATSRRLIRPDARWPDPGRRSTAPRADSAPRTRSSPVLDVANLEVVYNDVILVLRGLSLDGARRADRRAARQQRGRQDDHAAGHLRTARRARRQDHQGLDHVRRRAHSTGTNPAAHRAPRHHPGDGGPAGVRRADRRREPQLRRHTPTGHASRSPRLRAGDDAVPPARRAAQAGRRVPVRRRAADARDRPGVDGRSQAARSSTSRRSAWRRCSSSRSATSSSTSTSRARACC